MAKSKSNRNDCVNKQTLEKFIFVLLKKMVLERTYVTRKIRGDNTIYVSLHAPSNLESIITIY